MRLFSHGIDEYTLAAYLSGGLAPSRRREVAQFLSENEDARELLFAARGLLETEGDGAAYVRPNLDSIDLPTKRRPFLTASRRLSLLLWTTLTLVCVTAFATTMLVAFRAGVDVGEARVIPPADPGRLISIQGPFSQLSWTPVPMADRYRLIVWDDAAEEMRGSVESDVPVMDYAGLAAYLQDASSPRVWVDAFDVRGELLARTRSIRVN